MVYIIEAKSDGKSIFKIGTTGNCPWIRLDQLRRQNAIPLQLVAGMIGNAEDEANFHNVFKKWRLHGEWFSDCSGIRLLIKDFPIDEWDEISQQLLYGWIDFSEAYRQLTGLKFANGRNLTV
jgi:hypothetical protein